MKSMKLALLVFILPTLTAISSHAQFGSPCGDADGNGTVDIGDLTYAMNYLFANGAAPPNFDTADFDGYQLYTLRDIYKTVECLFACDNADGAAICTPTLPPLMPPVDPVMKLRYTDTLPANVGGSYAIRVGYMEQSKDLGFMVAPMKFLVNGMPANIDSVVFDSLPSGILTKVAKIGDSGRVLFTMMVMPTQTRTITNFAHVYVNWSPAGTLAPVEVEWTAFTPSFAPPEQENSLYSMCFSTDADIGDFGDYVPELEPNCCFIPGDIDDNERVNIGDVTFGIARIFASGPAPHCAKAANVNGDLGFNIGDITFLIGYIFSGGSEPQCAVNPPAPPDTAQYTVTFDAVWSEITHPDSFPPNPHFSGLIGGTHTSNVQFWEPGELASLGIKNMAEFGSKTALDSEVQSAITAGDAQFVLSGGGIGNSPGSVQLTFEITNHYPLVTLVSMIAPSPDWFVGVRNLPLYKSGSWVDSIQVTLYPYDAGTDDGVIYTSANAVTTPFEPIAQITGFPFLVDTAVPTLGTFTFRKQ